jgi:hypothetical protein
MYIYRYRFVDEIHMFVGPSLFVEIFTWTMLHILVHIVYGITPVLLKCRLCKLSALKSEILLSIIGRCEKSNAGSAIPISIQLLPTPLQDFHAKFEQKFSHWRDAVPLLFL